MWGCSSTKGMSIENLYRGLGKIKMICMHFDRTIKLAIQKTLRTFKLQEGKLITKFNEEFQGAFNEAATSRLTFDDAQLVIFLLAKLLPTSHQPFISTHRHDTTLTFPTIIGRFFQEEALTKTTPENGNTSLLCK